MRKIFLTLMIFAASNSHVEAQSPTCDRFRTGTFLYFSADNDLIKVKRKHSRQSQFNLTKDRFAVSSRIKWTSDCTFKVFNDDAHIGFPPAEVTITPISDSTFRSVCSCGVKDTTTWMIFDKKKFDTYKKTHETL